MITMYVPNIAKLPKSPTIANRETREPENRVISRSAEKKK
tara:strand:- start:2968 stop:3087 length:120 start_codon:yes stop_codon:yes gene_type:complete